MNNTIDFSGIAQTALSNSKSLIESWIPGGKYSGDEYTVKNPTRPDNVSGSFKINTKTGSWSDFATPDKGGDLISLYAYINNMSQKDAAIQLGKELLSSPPIPNNQKPETSIKYTPVDPIPDDAPAPPRQRNIKPESGDWIHYPFTHVWPYKNQLGVIRFYVVRYETPTGKETPPLSLWKTSEGKYKWRHKRIEGLLPLYNLDKIAHSPKAQVIVVEGEKCAQFAQEIIEQNHADADIVFTTWHGGANAVNKTDWSPLQNRNTILWPDFDLKSYPDKHEQAGEVMPITEQPGYTAMVQIAMILSKQKCKLLMIKPVEGKKDGWDIADGIFEDGMKYADIIAFIKANRFKPEIPESEPEHNEPLPLPEDYSPEPLPPENYDELDEPEFPFRCLGYDGEYCFYLPNGMKQVRQIKIENHSKGTLLGLAPLQWWEKNYPSKQGPAWNVATNALLRVNERVGVYNPARQRGRGAWFDKGRSVLHLGDKVIVDGKVTEIPKLDSYFVYEAGSALEHSVSAAPLSVKDANNFQQISDMLFWEKPIHAKMFTGWCICAIICGALRHRPHLWLTAKPGAGKSHVIDEIMKPVLGEFAHPLASDTTEAGVRQKLGNDALSVLIDEFEGEDWEAQQRVQSILKLARLSFSDNGALIVKGGQNHKSISFQIRSCFFMSSVGVNLYQHADETRVSVLQLAEPYDKPEETKEKHFDRLVKKVTETLTDEWCAAFRLRAIKMIPVIRKNADTFERAAARKIGNRRAGDQVGPLLAGAFSLCSDSVITAEKATEWIEKQDWSEQKNIASKSDEKTCLANILEATIKHPTKPDDVSIAELLEYCQEWKPVEIQTDADYKTQPAVLSLKRVGLRLDRDEGLVWISESHRGLRKLLDKTPWSKAWGRLLRRINGAVVCEGMRFSGTVTKAVGIPWNEAMGDV
jgi:putative DNA primase/helicase